MSIGSPLPRVPAFEDFYAAVNNGRRPFPWQARLTEQVLAEGRWPAEIGIPTGLGKTSCLDVAVWWLAAEADRGPQERRAPTRIWWVVNRRLLVDTTAVHADRIARLLCESAIGRVEAGHPAIESVARRLQHLTAGGTGEPLQIEKLRGGVALGRPRDPAQPSIILSTVPMFGSRLLFRGYGSSRSMRPIDAALAGTDSLVLVDEAHLATHLMRLVPALRECAPTEALVLPGERSWPQVVSLTATGDADADRFELDDDDRSHHAVQQRLSAHKRLEVRKKSKGRLTEELADATLDLLRDADRATSCVVFANTPADAREVFMRIKSQQDRLGLDALLLTGRSRECDAEAARSRVVDPEHGAPSGHDQKRKKSLVVVATQTLEVGADVDFEFLVTEQCGTRALIQRLGRLNRLGRHSDSRAIYVHLPAPSRKDTDLDGWPVYGREPKTVLEILERSQGLDGDIDVSPQHVRGLLGAPNDDPGRAPEILPALLWEWTKTTTPPPGEAPVEPYFSGVADPVRSASVMWRCHVPPSGHRLWPRPRDAETVDIPLRELRVELKDDELVRLGSDGVTAEVTTASRLRPGDVVVLPTDRGLLDEFGWSPESDEIVADVSLEASGLPLEATALRRCCGVNVAHEVRRALQGDAEEPDDDERSEAAADLIESLRACPPPHFGEDEWHGFLDRLDRAPVDVEDEVSRLVLRETDEPAPYDEHDEVSLVSGRAVVELDLHGQAVGERARQVATALGVSAAVVSVVGRAADLHDVGKADERFQRWLSDGEPSRPALAKSRLSRSRWAEARAAAGWPRGGRHEELSARLVQNWLQCQEPDRDEQLDDLLIHLVVSHHGRGRPFVMPVSDGTSSPVRCDIDGVMATACADLSVADWEQPERFARLNLRYGPWGVALLEAVVRQADHMVSAGGDVR
ncbi:MAG: type I-U CRISPR-associated helicase/endonuclease Cas3 [Acidimicrobiales bacterium]|nr:type I-U CRISPR-associated helicase/endonuclease Cas3 [Acidimicrobiales bacterium]MXZ14727.1 type I-U CRISPR-associated helicase/endonuclease Cas3 [Acidimicrobiales bacterium]MYA25998.1 type I-U CRISPR-associated helicase/endonuclease Cas3 [Acidimicrobiales bacterium]MYB80038.1 type I-U CRISPR-associated helicase/endonuclease Cas3 [Acidimicrobiales bacterium]MYD83061.1 type I-U CRISPR-associated helicase/endonuclease Cas3 [Acidimicrobiales bacterium]